MPAPEIPHDQSAEFAFLSDVLADEGRTLEDLRPALGLDLFWHASARLVAGAMLALHDARQPLNWLSLTQWLRDAGQLEAAGGVATVTEIALSGVPAAAAHQLERLRDQLARRRLLQTGHWLSDQARLATQPAAVLEEAARRLAAIEPAADCAADHALPGALATVFARLERMDRGEVEPFLPTPLQAWNNAFTGLLDGHYYALGGRPGTGKTALMEQMIFHPTTDDTPVLLFERDMSLTMLLERIACRAAGVPFWRFARRRTSAPERDRIRTIYQGLKESRFRLHNPHRLGAAQLCAIVRREQRLHGVRAVFLDHIQLLDTGSRDLREGLTQATITLSQHVPESNIPHVVLFHINRTGARGRPSPEDVKEFDQLFGDVDGMAMLWSEVRAEDVPRGQMRPMILTIAKNRNGAVTDEPLCFDGELMRFVDAPAATSPARKAA